MGINVAVARRPVQLTDPEPNPDPVSDLLAFAAHCETHGHMVAGGLMTVQEAVDGLWEAAEQPGGPLRFLDVDTVQDLVANAFGRGLAYAHTAEPSPPVAPIEEPPPPPPRRRELATSTVDALRYVISQRDPKQLRRFLARRGRDELAAMFRLMGAK